MTDEQIKHMVDRFLGWRLPENFSPDDGISFEPLYNIEYNAARGKPPARRQPTGTNLFDAGQAEAMVRYMIEGMPAVEPSPDPGVAHAGCSYLAPTGGVCTKCGWVDQNGNSPP